MYAVLHGHGLKTAHRDSTSRGGTLGGDRSQRPRTHEGVNAAVKGVFAGPPRVVCYESEFSPPQLSSPPFHHGNNTASWVFTLDFQASQAVKNEFLYKLPRPWYSVTAIQNRLRRNIGTKK